jgi:hypothetical protein
VVIAFRCVQTPVPHTAFPAMRADRPLVPWGLGIRSVQPFSLMLRTPL